MRFAAILLSCLLLVGCATQPVAPDKALAYKRIGVLSAMGDSFALNAVGVTVFGNEAKTEELKFGADDMLSEKAIQALSAKYEVVDLTKYREAFLAQPKYWPGQKGMFAPDAPTAQEVVRNLMGAEQLDAYLVITPASFAVRGTNQSGGGIGIMKLQKVISSNDHRLHAAYIVTVVDGKDYSYTADMRAIPVDESSAMSFMAGSSPLSSPNWPVLQKHWEAAAANKEEIRQMFDLLVSQSVPHTLRRAQLLN